MAPRLIARRARRARRRGREARETIRSLARWLLAALLAVAGAAHLGPGRRGFRVVVPEWATRLSRLDADTIIVVSGVAEIALAGALVAVPRRRHRVGLAVAAFFVAVFPGNVHQWRSGRSAPGLDTDARRLTRLFLQPVLVAWALWSTHRGGRER